MKGTSAGTARLTRVLLALLALLAAALGYMGVRGLHVQTDSGFKYEGTFQAIYALSGDTAAAWEKLKPAAEKLPEAERGAFDGAVLTLLADAWDTLMGEGAGEEARALASSDGGMACRLLYATCTPYLSNGKLKLAKSARDALTALPQEELPALRSELIRCLTDPEAEVPAALEKAAQGDARGIALAQALFVTAGSEAAAASEAATVIRKEIAASDTALSVKAAVFRMAAEHGISFVWQFIVNHARTVIAAGVLLLLDTVLLALLMFREKRWAFDIKWILILLIADFLLYFLLLPLVYLMIRAFSDNGVFSLERFRHLFENPDNRTALFTTLAAAAATMVLGTLLAFPLAWLVGRTNLYGKKFFRSLFVLTYMVPPYVGAMAWQQLLNPNVGMINRVLRAVFALGDGPGPLNIYTVPGLIWALTTFYYPYAFITISRAMEKMDPSLEEASRISGASPVRTVLRVTLPLMTPSLIAGALLVFVSAASCYGIPSIIAGGTTGMYTVTTRIKEIYSSGQQNLNDATGLAVILMAIALVILFVSDVLLARRQYTTVSGKSVSPAMVDLRRWRVPLTVLVVVFALVVIFLPFWTILSISLKSDMGKSLFAAGNFTLQNWGVIFENATLISLRNSLVFAAIAASVGIVIACVMSHLLQRTRIRGRGIPNFLITLGSGTPSVVIALGLIMTMSGSFGLNIVGTASIIVIAYMIKYLMMGMRTVVSAMSQIHVSLEESSQISGAGWLRTMRRITGPLILPSIAAGWFLIFIPCFYELSMTVLLFSSGTQTIGVQLYQYWSTHSNAVGCAMAFGILAAVAVLNFILGRLTKGKFSI